MRTCLAFCLVIVVSSPPVALARQTPRSVRIQIAALDTVCYPNCAHPTEWKVTAVAELLDSSGAVLPPQAQALYEWGADFCDGAGMSWGFASGSGLWIFDMDGNKVKNSPTCCPDCPYQSYLIAVRVTGPGLQLTSRAVRVPDGGVEWSSTWASVAPNPYSPAKGEPLMLSLPLEDATVQISIVSLTGDLLYRREYPAYEYFGRRLVQVPAADLPKDLGTGVYFVVAKTSRDQHLVRVAIVAR